jgi:hypothetical protein
MPRVLPGVDIQVTDKSQVILTNDTVLFASLGQFSRGTSTPTLVTNKDEFEKWFGTYADTASAGKKAYVGISNLLNSATGVYVANVYDSAVRYGGMTVDTSNKKTVLSGATQNTSYTFTTYTETPVTTFTLGAGTGALLFFRKMLVNAPVKPTTATFTATVNGVAYTFTDDGIGGFIDSTGVLLNSTSYIHYNTGYVYILFKAGKFPDNSTNVVMSTYTYYATSAYTPVVAEVIGVGDGVDLTFSYTIPNTPIKPGTVTVSATIVATPRTATDTNVIDANGYSALDDATNTYYDETAVTGSRINYATGALELVFKAGQFPATATNITVSYTSQGVQSFALIAKSPQTWSANYGITISAGSQDYTFYVNEYVIESGTTTLLNSYLVSRDSAALDGFGNRIYIEEVINANSDNFVAINNADVHKNIIPLNNSTIFYAGGGVVSGTPGASDYVTSINLFDDVQYSWNVLVGNSREAVTELQAISTVVTNQEKFAMVDCQNSPNTAATLKTWAMTTIALDNERMAFYCPNAKVSYLGQSVPICASALAAERYANTVKNGQRFMPPAGVERGTVTVVSLDAYYSDANILDLHEANLNVIKSIRGYGNVIFSDFTMQTATTATSYINSVFTLNDMLSTFKSSLITINFKVINEITYLELRSLIDSYMSQLALQDGTIEPTYSITCDSTNNTAQTKALREIHCDVVFVFQGLAQQIKLNLTYTTSALYATLV